MSVATQVNGRAGTGPRAASRAALDVMLTDAAVDSGTVGRLVQPGAVVRLAGGLSGTAQGVDELGRLIVNGVAHSSAEVERVDV